jgi:ribokinase
VVVADLEVPPGLVLAALGCARERGLRTVLDPAPADRVTDELLALADHVVPDAAEATHLTGVTVAGVDDAVAAGRTLIERGAGCAHVKLAGGGAVVVDSGGVLHVEAPVDIDVVDATGAGDAYAGGLGWALLRGVPFEEAAVLAVAASTCAVTAFGSQESYPTEAELRAMAGRVRATRT